MRRVILIVLDSVGAGELPDADKYGDAGCNTLGHIADAVGGLNMPNLAEMGLGNIIPIKGVQPVDSPAAFFGKMSEASKGKDTTTGHWEMMGVVTNVPFPTYPNGFPADVISSFEKKIGRRVIGNKVASGTVIINELGDEHMQTGCPIVYTSADSVFQIACHEDIISVDKLYEMCQITREMLVAPHNVQRVIARPFIGKSGAYERTQRRRDFALEPPKHTLLDKIVESNGEVVAIGKIEDIFAHRGISKSDHTGNNPDGIKATVYAIKNGEGSLVFTNLVDFDMVYGHRNNTQGYAQALEDFDNALPGIVDAMLPTDILMITADHGCDPTFPGTDHTREYVPLIAYQKGITCGGSLGVRKSFCDVASTIADILEINNDFDGDSFADHLKLC